MKSKRRKKCIWIIWTLKLISSALQITERCPALIKSGVFRLDALFVSFNPFVVGLPFRPVSRFDTFSFAKKMFSFRFSIESSIHRNASLEYFTPSIIIFNKFCRWIRGIFGHLGILEQFSWIIIIVLVKTIWLPLWDVHGRVRWISLLADVHFGRSVDRLICSFLHFEIRRSAAFVRFELGETWKRWPYEWWTKREKTKGTLKISSTNDSM